MIVEPNDLLLFAHVVDEGGFSRAAGRLGLPKSTVSRRVSALETQLGERLLLRTTRKLSVTDFGLAVLEHAHHVVEDVAAATSLAQNRQIEPAGRLRVTMPSDLGTMVLAPLLADAARRAGQNTALVSLCTSIRDCDGGVSGWDASLCKMRQAEAKGGSPSRGLRQSRPPETPRPFGLRPDAASAAPGSSAS